MKSGFLLTLLLLLTVPCITVKAAEEEYPDISERTNSMEIRLEEYGTTLAEIEERLAVTESGVADTEIQRLALSQQLDVVIVGLDALNEEVQNICLQIMESEEKRQESTAESMKQISGLNKTADELLLETVSGNIAISDMGQSLMESIESNSEMSVRELTETLAATNSMLVKLYCILFALIVIIIVDVLYRLLWNRLFKHAFGN